MKFADRLAELLAFAGISDGVIERAAGQADHLRADGDTAFVEGFDGDLVALPNVTHDVFARYAAVVQNQFAGGRGAQPEFVFFLTYLEAGKFALHQERRHSLVAGLRIGIGEEQEKAGLAGVGDPQLAPIQQEMVAVVVGARGHGKGIGARPGFRQGVGGDGIPGQARQVFGFLFGRGPAQQRVIADGVLDIDNHAGRGVHGGEFFDGQDGLKEGAALAAVFLGDFDSHETHVEELLDDLLAEDAGLVHFAHKGADLLAGELAHRGLEESFVFGERRQRRRGRLQRFEGVHVRSLLQRHVSRKGAKNAKK